jgi:thymidylate kinase
MKQIYSKVFCMLVKVFILGLPGSGKSLASRFLMSLLRERGWNTYRFKDYDILLEMFREDTTGSNFNGTPYNGFDVLNLSVFDEALHKLEEKVSTYIPYTMHNELILIEFARANYSHALKQFEPAFLRYAYFLFVQSDIEICINRISERVRHSNSLDDHYVSPYIFDKYYRHNNDASILSDLVTSNGIDDRSIKIIENNRSLANLETELEQFVNFMLLDLMLK